MNSLCRTTATERRRNRQLTLPPPNMKRPGSEAARVFKPTHWHKIHGRVWREHSSLFKFMTITGTSVLCEIAFKLWCVVLLYCYRR